MIISVDLRSVPPRTDLLEPHDFGTLKVVVTDVPEHFHLTRATLLELAGSAREDPAWVEQLDAMLDVAAGAGWVDDAGTVRAHVERVWAQR